MSRKNVRDFLKKLSNDSRQKFEIDLANLEAVFDLGFFQQDEGRFNNFILFYFAQQFIFVFTPKS